MSEVLVFMLSLLSSLIPKFFEVIIKKIEKDEYRSELEQQLNEIKDKIFELIDCVESGKMDIKEAFDGVISIIRLVGDFKTRLCYYHEYLNPKDKTELKIILQQIDEIAGPYTKISTPQDFQIVNARSVVQKGLKNLPEMEKAAEMSKTVDGIAIDITQEQLAKYKETFEYFLEAGKPYNF